MLEGGGGRGRRGQPLLFSQFLLRIHWPTRIAPLLPSTPTPTSPPPKLFVFSTQITWVPTTHPHMCQMQEEKEEKKDVDEKDAHPLYHLSDFLKSSPPLPCLGNYSLKNCKCPFPELRKTARETRTVDPFTCDPIHSDVCLCVLLTIHTFTVCTHLECNVLLWSAMSCSTAWSWPPVLRPEDETDTTPTFSMPICLALFIDEQYNNKLEKKPAFTALSFYA